MAQFPRCLVAMARLVPALFMLAASSGCDDDGLQRVSGKVTFKGKPVPAGKIYFSPDGSKGNTGATGYADIEDGSYDTSWAGGRGVVNGPNVVAIEGHDPAAPAKPDPSSEVTATTLFPHYEVALDIAGVTAKDFDVPDAAAKPKRGHAPNGTVTP